MSNVSDSAVVRIFVAQYIAADAASKLNMIGGGLLLIGLQPPNFGAGEGNTVPFGIGFSVSVGRELYGEECSIEVVLEDLQGHPVQVPTPDGKGRQALRVAQNHTFEEPTFPPGTGVPRGVLLSRVQWVLMFPGGLALPTGAAYQWRVKIDHESRDEWTERFYVPAARGPVVIG
ncbi:MAG: hypothetical protein JO100_02510 [Pseudonocardia sp.]|nr:hypothetical protein [Pseudonocardia sp.]